MNILITKNMEYVILSLKEFGHNINYIEPINIVDGFHDISSYDIIILDTDNHSIESCEIATFIKNKCKNMGIVFISSDNSLKTKINAFNSGADDYITDDMPIIEIIARLKALYHRCRCNFTPDNKLILGELTLDYETREAKRNDDIITLTTKEFLLLEYFMKNKNILLTRNQIKEHIWGIDFINETNIVDVYITKLRNKIDKDYNYKFFHTIRGSGYIFKYK